MRRLLVISLICSSLLGVACSSKTWHAGWCAVHAARLVHDIRAHRHGYAALQALLVAHHCSKVL